MALDVLLVEDSPADRLLTREALTEAGGFRLTCCERLGEALRLLSESHFDVVLLDLGLPDTQGLETVRRLRQRHSKVAVVVLTERDDEASAVRALREGADDYLVKNQADGGQLRRAIRYAVERAQAAERLRGSEERFRMLVEGGKDYAVMMLDPAGKVVTWNTGAERIYGRTASEVVGQDSSRFFRAEDVASGLPELELREARATGRSLVEGWRVRKDGSQFWANGAVTALYDDAGAVRGFAKITRDLTERKEVAERLAATERLFHQLADAMPQIVWTARPDGQVDYYNERWYEYTGAVRGAVGDESWRPILHPDDLQRGADSWYESVRNGRPFQVELRFRDQRTGGYRWHLVRGLPARDAAGTITRWIGTSTDIEDLKQAEQEVRDRSRMAELAAEVGSAFATGGGMGRVLQASAESLVRHLDAALARIWTLNEAENVLELRASAGINTQLDGPQSRVPVGWFKIGLIAQERKPHLTNALVGDPRVSDPEWVRREGMVAFAGYPLLADNRVMGVMAVFARRPLADVTLRAMGSVADVLAVGIKRCKAEESLRGSEELLRGAFEYTKLPTVITDISNRFVRVNAAFLGLFGYTEEEMLKLSMGDITHPEDLAESYASRETLLAGKSHHFQIEKRYHHKDGHVIWGLTNVSLVRDAHGVPAYYVGQVQDITERKRVESERDALLARLQLQIERMPVAYILFDSDMRIVDWNPAAERIFGYSRQEALRMDPIDLTLPKFRDQAEQLIARLRAADTKAHSVNENVTRDGRTIICEWYNTPLSGEGGRFDGILSLVQDVTDRISLESQLRQSQKMEAIGSLAGGVAHDFNNLLTIINGYSEVIQGQLAVDSPLKGLAREIGRAGERAAGLTRQLLAFSRKQVLEPKVLNLNAIVTDTAKMLKRLIGEDIDLATALEPALGRVKADAGQVEQVLINLSVNARDAMPQGGKLTIETVNVELDATYTQAFPELRPGPYVMLAVSDTGVGMDEATRTRIFEPFFTTKEAGKGTGLGLATVFGIVKQSGGHVAVYSEPGHGATFKVYLPRVEDIAPAGKSHPGLRATRKGTETILLVEDEPALLALSRHVLQMQGYTVLEASGGESAIRLAQQYDGTMDLVVTDVVMPGMSGRRVAEHIAALRPGVKMLFLSGYTDDAVVRHGVLQSETAFLQKPFTPTALTAKVREVLDG